MSDARLIIHPGGAVHWSHREAVSRHASQAWKLVIGLEGPVDVVHGDGFARARCVLVAPYAPQAIASDGLSVSYLAEPGTRQAPFGGAGPGIRLLDGKLRDRVIDIARLRTFTAHDDHAVQQEVFRSLGLEDRPPPSAKVADALSRVASDPDVTLAEIAERARLSSTRLRHLVRESTGLTLRGHRLWHRTLRAVEHMLTGAPIARAAITAGFADHAHFTRSFVRFFGRTPSSISGRTYVIGAYARRRSTAELPRPLEPVSPG